MIVRMVWSHVQFASFAFLTEALNTLAEKKAVWQKVVTSSYVLSLFRVY